MANAILIAPLTAAYFETGSAAAGDVLTADGAGGATMEAPASGLLSIDEIGTMVVSGAEPDVNGTYTKTSDWSGVFWADYTRSIKLEFIVSMDPFFIGEAWVISGTGGVKYRSDSDVTPSHPGLVPTWLPYQVGTSLTTVVVAQISPVPAGYPPVADGAEGITWKRLPPSSIDPMGGINQVLMVRGPNDSKTVGFENAPLPVQLTPWGGYVSVLVSSELDSVFEHNVSRAAVAGDLLTCYDEVQSKIILLYRGLTKWSQVSLGAEIQ